MISIPKKFNETEVQSLFELKYPGYRLKDYEIKGNRLYLDLEPNELPICPNCRKKDRKINSRQERVVKDYPIFNDMEQFVRFHVRRVRCECGCKKCEVISWVQPRARLTNELIAAIQSMLRCQLPASDIAEMFNLSWDTIRTYDKFQLKDLFEHIDMGHVRHLAVDEFSLHKGHRYATVVMDIEDCQVLWIGKGKSKASIQPFFDLLRKQGHADKIESVSCDMNAAYPKLFKENLPQAKIVYDLFHVIKNFTEVLAKARKKCAEDLKQVSDKNPLHKQQIKELKSAEWILAQRPDDLTVPRKQRLDRLINDNALLAALYPLVDAIRQIWRIKNPAAAFKQVEWVRSVLLEINKQFDFKPAKQFAGMLLRRIDGIVYAGKLGFTTNRLEGANNKIKTERRKAYGYRDTEYFFLKIKSLLPGLKSNPWKLLRKGAAILKDMCWLPAFYVRS